MKYEKTLIFLSPIPWLFHNRQIALYAKELSRSFNVIYIDCSSMGNNSISVLDLLRPSKLLEYKKFWKDIKSKRISLIKKPRVITLKRYKPKKSLNIIDRYLFLKQIKNVAQTTIRKNIVTKNTKLIIWTSTLQFENMWKTLKNVDWVFDFFDRYPIHSEEIAATEKWLLKNSKVVFVNSDFYENLARKTLKKDPKIIFTPVGYYLSPYLSVKPKKESGKLVVGYGGGLSDRLDFDLVIESVKQNPDINFIFAGPIYEKAFHTIHKPYSTAEFVQKLTEFPNVKLMPTQRGPKGIKRIMSQFDIGWIPYNTKVPFNKYSTPTKFYEYCAFGLPTISTKMEIMKEHADLVDFLDDSKNFGKIVKKVISENSKVLIKARKKYASENDLIKKSKVVFGVLNSL